MEEVTLFGLCIGEVNSETGVELVLSKVLGMEFKAVMIISDFPQPKEIQHLNLIFT